MKLGEEAIAASALEKQRIQLIAAIKKSRKVVLELLCQKWGVHIVSRERVVMPALKAMLEKHINICQLSQLEQLNSDFEEIEKALPQVSAQDHSASAQPPEPDTSMGNGAEELDQHLRAALIPLVQQLAKLSAATVGVSVSMASETYWMEALLALAQQTKTTDPQILAGAAMYALQRQQELRECHSQ